ncbi:flagellar basal-body MS-ring/collar protein FliF [Limnohabitans sp. DM1]|uniref:flagellar basal-body MS-ring/collar protein FliF n=1 Tax=Limnohabitans sp. DM1 TaxID=1597955 RepID=UPI000B2EF816|nr:flagellar basal-body MS-ring/collar protein FliF [Limnohabitans sp. DM1]
MTTALIDNAMGAAALNTFTRLEPAQRFRMLSAIFLVMALFVGGYLLSRQVDWKILYVNLSDKDGGSVIAQLSQMNIAYKHSEGGAILVPADKVHEIRLRLATQGLPKGSGVGYELMDTSRFGMTQFQERLTFQRGLEGELTRSIQSLGSVQGARVHLAMPQQNGFFREQQKPSASVLLSLHSGKFLDRSQIAGVVHLVASSVPELDPKSVSVVDDSGNLLSAPGGAAGGPETQQIQYTRQVEIDLAHRIEDILAPLVGRQNVKAQVSVDIDFSQVEYTSESHQPNTNGGVIRSQQLIENNNIANASVSGVPGASSNQAVAPSTMPLNATASNVNGVARPNSQSSNGTRNSVTNYEIDRTVKTVKSATGALTRVSAAVVLNDKFKVLSTVSDAADAPAAKPLSPEQMDQFSAVVKEAIGFKADRGDSVKLISGTFNVEKFDAVEIPWWKQTEIHTMIKNMVWLIGVVVAAFAVFMVLRPMLRGLRMTTHAVEPLLDAVVADLPQRPVVEPVIALPSNVPPALAIQSMASDQRLQDVRKLAKENPAAVADIVKSWIQGDNT